MYETAFSHKVYRLRVLNVCSSYICGIVRDSDDLQPTGNKIPRCDHKCFIKVDFIGTKLSLIRRWPLLRWTGHLADQSLGWTTHKQDHFLIKFLSNLLLNFYFMIASLSVNWRYGYFLFILNIFLFDIEPSYPTYMKYNTKLISNIKKNLSFFFTLYNYWY